MTNIVVVTPTTDAYSETFIRAHIERLPANVKVLYGGYFPLFQQGGTPITPPLTLARHLKRSAVRRIRGLTMDDLQRKDLVRILKRYSTHAVLTEYGPTGLAVMDACVEANIPLIAHFHGYDVHNKDTLRDYGPRYPELFSKAAAIVAVSRETVGELINLGAEPAKVHYNPCGVDVGQFRPGAPEKAPPLFQGVGRFITCKGHYLSLLAFSRVVGAAPEARLCISGDGPLWEPCRRLACALGIESAVDLPGSQPHDQIALMMRQARACVHHSVKALSGDSEGTPLAILEAGAAGLPVIGSRVGGIPEVVVHGVTGFLVDEGDVEGMAAAMLLLAQDPQLAARMGQAGRKRVEECFSMEQSIGRLWRIIESAMDGGPSGRAPR